MAEDNEIIAKLKVEGLSQYKAELTSAAKSTDTATSAIEKMEAAMADIPKGTKEFEKLANELEAVKSVASITSDELENNKTVLRRYTKEISDLAVAMDKLKSEGKQNTQTYRDIEKAMKETAKKAGELKDKIGDINSVIKNLGSDTRGIDNVVRGVGLMSNSYQAFLGVQSLVGKENKNLQEGLLKLNAVMAVTQSIQQIGNELTAEDSIVKQAAAKATAAYNFVVGASTGALKLFRIAVTAAMGAMGIGILIAVIANWDKLKAAITGASTSLEDYKKRLEEKEKLEKLQKDRNDLSIAFMKAIGKYTDEQAKRESQLYLERSKESKRQEFANQLEKQKQLNEELEKQKEILKKTPKSTTSTITTAYGTTVSNSNDISSQIAKINTIQQRLDEQKKITDLSRVAYMKATVELKNAQDAAIEKLSKETNKTSSSTENAIKKTATEAQNNLQLLRQKLQQTEKDIEDLVSSLVVKGEDITKNSKVALLNQQFTDLQLKIEQTENAIEKAKDALFGKNIETLKPIDVPIKLKPEAPEVFIKPLEKIKEKITGSNVTGINEDVLAFFGIPPEKEFETAVQARVAIAQGMTEKINEIGSEFAKITSSAISIKAQRDIEILEEQKNRGLLSEKEYSKKVSEIKNEAARKERAVQIATATAQIPMAILSAFIGTPGGIIAKGIAAALAGAFAAAQVAIIAATPLPKFRQGGSVAKVFRGSGYVHGKSHEQGGVNAELEGNEYVIRGKAVNKYGMKFLDSVNSLKLNPVIASTSNNQKTDNALRDNLILMASYAKQSTRLDQQGNKILKGIYNKLNARKVYV